MSRWLSIAALALVFACGKRGTTAHRQPDPEAAAATAAPVRVIVFAGSPVDVAGYAPGRAEPALPAGLQLDDRGHLTGVPIAPDRGQLYRIVAASGKQWPVFIEIVAPVKPGDVVVAPKGDDAADGSLQAPVRTIAKALALAKPGTVILLRTGRFAEDVSVRNLHGEAGAPITIRSYPGEHASLEGARLDVQWTRATEAGAARDEWVSTQAFPVVRGENLANRGVFFDRTPYTRLLTYGRIEDMRAENQRWVLDGSSPAPAQIKVPMRPWTYFGPGIWQDPETGLIHLRLSPTANAVPGLADYTGPQDPAKLELGVWYRASVPLNIARSSHIEVRDVGVVGGGERSVDIEASEDIVLDHVDIRAGSEGLSIRQSSRIKFLHGRVDGGVPPWTFRSDYKDNYTIVAPGGGQEPNNLIRKTSRALLAINQGNREIEIGYCEIQNGHDNTLSGIGSELHHCRFRDIQDDALFISHTAEIGNMRIHDNVFERIMTGLSGEGRRSTGDRFVYRNVFDMRDPVPGFRPGLKDGVWRFGALFKGDFSAGPMYFYQNTVLLNRPGEQVALSLFRSLEPDGVAINPRWFVNNVVSVDNSAYDQTLSFVPADVYLTAKRADGTPVLRSDGNVWIRTGTTRTPMFKCMSRSTKCVTREWRDLDTLRATGFESHSRAMTVGGFVKVKSVVAGTAGDDLRLTATARGTGVELPAELPDTAASKTRDAGAFSGSAAPWFIGVDGRLTY